MNFSEALSRLKDGLLLCRRGWNGKGMWIEIQLPTPESKMTRPYIFMSLPPGSTNQLGEPSETTDRVPWLASQTDLLAEDWQEMAVQKTA